MQSIMLRVKKMSEMTMSYKAEKKLVEDFKRYIQEEDDKLQLYCDMDGVLVDFETGAINAMNRTLAQVASDRERLSQIEPDRKNPEYTLYKTASKAVEEQGGDWNIDDANEVTTVDGEIELKLWLFGEESSEDITGDATKDRI